MVLVSIHFQEGDIAARAESLAQGQADPPDVQVAAGPTAIVEMVNTVYAMWSRSGVLLDSGQLDQFFTSSGVNRKGDEVTDPRILYDTSTQRWFAALFDVTRGEALVGVSDTSDPAGDWNSSRSTSRIPSSAERVPTSRDSGLAMPSSWSASTCSRTARAARSRAASPSCSTSRRCSQEPR